MPLLFRERKAQPAKPQAEEPCSARLVILAILESGISAELTLITSRTSSTVTPAKQTLAPKKKRREPDLRNFGEKNHVEETMSKNNACAFEEHVAYVLLAKAIMLTWS